MTKEKEVKAETGKTVKDFTIEQLKVMHFDNQGQMNYLRQANQTILEEINKRGQ